MSATDADNAHVDYHLEIQVLPVSDADRAKKFYESLGWRLDDDAAPMPDLRIVQFTPPGSGTSITFGQGLTAAAPGSAVAGLIVSDIVAAHADLVARGIEGSDIWPGSPVPTPSAPATGRSAPSPTPTATRTWCRRSRRATPVGSTPVARHSRPAPTWRTRSGGPRPPTTSTRRTPGGTCSAGRSRTKTGPPGTPPTWWRSRPARTCPPDRFGTGLRMPGCSGPGHHGRSGRLARAASAASDHSKRGTYVNINRGKREQSEAGLADGADGGAPGRRRVLGGLAALPVLVTG